MQFRKPIWLTDKSSIVIWHKIAVWVHPINIICLDILNLGEVIAKHASHKSIEVIKRHATASDTLFFKAVNPECFQK